MGRLPFGQWFGKNQVRRTRVPVKTDFPEILFLDDRLLNERDDSIVSDCFHKPAVLPRITPERHHLRFSRATNQLTKPNLLLWHEAPSYCGSCQSNGPFSVG